MNVFLIYILIKFLADGKIRNQCVTVSPHTENRNKCCRQLTAQGKDGVDLFLLPPKQKPFPLIVSNMDQPPQRIKSIMYKGSEKKERRDSSSTPGSSDNSFLPASALSVRFVVLHPALFFYMTSVPLAL